MHSVKSKLAKGSRAQNLITSNFMIFSKSSSEMRRRVQVAAVLSYFDYFKKEGRNMFARSHTSMSSAIQLFCVVVS